MKRILNMFMFKVRTSPRVYITGSAGVISVKSSDIFKYESGQRQLRAMKRLKEGGGEG